jgi:hypothetical protein
MAFGVFLMEVTGINNMKSGMWAAWLAVAALASACGGGGDDARPSSSGTTDALAPFVGRWQAPCLVRGDGARLASSTVEAPVYLSIGTEMTVALNGGRLEGRMTERFYNDDTCTTTVLATQSRSVSFTNDGPVTASGRAALKTTVTAGPTFVGISATNITMGSVT